MDEGYYPTFAQSISLYCIKIKNKSQFILYTPNTIWLN